MSDVGTSFTPASRPSNDASLDMGLPPNTSRLYGRSGRAALTAGTLTPVGDNTAREDVQRDVEMRDADRYDANVMHEQRLNPPTHPVTNRGSRGYPGATSAVRHQGEARIAQNSAVLPVSACRVAYYGCRQGYGRKVKVWPHVIVLQEFRRARKGILR